MVSQDNAGDRKQAPGAMVSALLDFEAMPGRYPVALREPRVLFDHSYSVLQLATGRQVESLSLDSDMLSRARRAARYFVRIAMLRQGADYYTLMGVRPGFDDHALRDNYRLLIRLSHPDFATPGQAWPANAATRINMANDVLSSSVKRHEYDLTLKNARSQVAAAFSPPRHRNPPATAHRVIPPHRASGQRLNKKIKTVLATIGTITVLLSRGASAAVTTLEQLVTRAARALLAPRTPAHENRAMRIVVISSVIAAVGASALTAWFMMSNGNPETGISEFLAQGESAVGHASSGAGTVTLQTARENETTSESINSIQAYERADARVRNLRPNIATELGSTLALPSKPATNRQSVGSGPPNVESIPSAAKTARSNARDMLQRAMGTPSEPSAQASISSLQTGNAALAPVTSPGIASFTTITEPAPNTVAIAAPQMLATSTSVANAGAMQAAARVKLVDVQPTLSSVLSAMESGRGENIAFLLDQSSRKLDSTSNFVHAYNRIVTGARRVQLGQVKFSSTPVDDQLVLDGVIQLFVQDQSAITTPRDFPVRAYFVLRGGNTVLTRLSTTERP
jgi:hypothetical protein